MAFLQAHSLKVAGEFSNFPKWLGGSWAVPKEEGEGWRHPHQLQKHNECATDLEGGWKNNTGKLGTTHADNCEQLESPGSGIERPWQDQSASTNN